MIERETEREREREIDRDREREGEREREKGRIKELEIETDRDKEIQRFGNANGAVCSRKKCKVEDPGIGETRSYVGVVVSSLCSPALLPYSPRQTMAKMTYAHIQISLQSKADDDACFFSVATTLH